MIGLLFALLGSAAVGSLVAIGCSQKKPSPPASIPSSSNNQNVTPGVRPMTSKTPDPASVRNKSPAAHGKDEKPKSLFHLTTESKQGATKSKNITSGGAGFNKTNELESPASHRKGGKQVSREEKVTGGSARSPKERSIPGQKLKPTPASAAPATTGKPAAGRVPNKEGYYDPNPQGPNHTEEAVKSTMKDKDAGYENLDIDQVDTRNLVNPNDVAAAKSGMGGGVKAVDPKAATKGPSKETKPKTLEKAKSERPKAAKTGSQLLTLDRTQEQSKHPAQ